MRFLAFERVELIAQAKLNLSLTMTGKREDGYHLLRSVMQKITLHDTIHLRRTQDDHHTVQPDHPDCPPHEKNIVHKALLRWCQKTGCPHHFAVLIEKRIPMAAGMAGGSTDAASVLRYLNDHAAYFEAKQLSDEALHDLATSLGADVPFCLTGVTALCEGIGELITHLEPLPEYPCLLIKGDALVSTAEAFQAIDALPEAEKSTVDHLAIWQDLKDGKSQPRLAPNDFLPLQESRHDYRFLQEVGEKHNHLMAGLSGSGPTFFVIFAHEDQRMEFKEALLAVIAPNRLIETTLSNQI